MDCVSPVTEAVNAGEVETLKVLVAKVIVPTYVVAVLYKMVVCGTPNPFMSKLFQRHRCPCRRYM